MSANSPKGGNWVKPPSDGAHRMTKPTHIWVKLKLPVSYESTCKARRIRHATTHLKAFLGPDFLHGLEYSWSFVAFNRGGSDVLWELGIHGQTRR